MRALRRGDVIPIQIDPGANSVTVEVAPDAAGSAGTPLSMKAQLVYHDGDDQPVYGRPSSPAGGAPSTFRTAPWTSPRTSCGPTTSGGTAPWRSPPP
ncbi:MAG TPA: hypothetical protein PLU22_25890, partial [Polyangiaceae bacterium]|nr:hypothetical protein [Polyangiaceae bacterium]